MTPCSSARPCEIRSAAIAATACVSPSIRAWSSARLGCFSSISSSIGSVRTSDGKRRGLGVHDARLALAALLPVALTACGELRETAARDVLADAGYEQVVPSPEPWLLGPCQWTEPYTTRFVAMKDGRRWAGVMCSTGEGGQDARIIAVAIVPQPATWDSFGRGGR